MSLTDGAIMFGSLWNCFLLFAYEARANRTTQTLVAWGCLSYCQWLLKNVLKNVLFVIQGFKIRRDKRAIVNVLNLVKCIILDMVINQVSYKIHIYLKILTVTLWTHVVLLTQGSFVHYKIVNDYKLFLIKKCYAKNMCLFDIQKYFGSLMVLIGDFPLQNWENKYIVANTWEISYIESVHIYN